MNRSTKEVALGILPPPLLSNESNIKAYRSQAAFYDATLGIVFAQGRRRALEVLAPQAGERVLEVGVGTGLSLPLYPPGLKLTGIDLSPEMLHRAERRVLGRPGIQLLQMDAQAMNFPDGSFDKAAAMYISSVVPDPAAMLRELNRVVRPGGLILILNHFSDPASLMSRCEILLQPLTRRLGFHPYFPLQLFLQSTGFVPERVESVKPFGYWTLLAGRAKPATSKA
jgi:phosphatidylethanolamine/phosphatidyl-N-methylethanolamine N-methyltransferase